jgi:hypothetical protein
MATRPQDMSVVKSDLAADTIASAIHDMAEGMVVSSASDASKQRMLRKHAREVVSLHDSLDEDEIFEGHNVAAVPENGRAPHGMPQIPAHQEG